MPPNKDLNDWLGDLSWQGYPRLAPIRDVASSADAAPDPAQRPRKGWDVRAAALARENEALRAKIETLASLAAEFERRLSEAVSAYEGAALDSESARRSAELENARLAGELESARAELARRESRDHLRESDLSLERERRADAEKALVEARRRVNDLEADVAATRSKAAELSGSVGELRRQASASHERLLQAKTLTDQDVQILRAEMREFLAKFHRIQETFAENQPGRE
jgi:chromosome segregation ATPase